MVFHDIFSKSRKIDSSKLVNIIADNREKNSLVISQLIGYGALVRLEQLQIGDYLINEFIIERKTISDLKSSIIDGRINDQIKNLKQQQSPLFIIKGLRTESIYSANFNQNSLKGFILSLVLKQNIPLIFTLDEKETAQYLFLLAKKKDSSSLPSRPLKSIRTKEETILFILQGFPNIGPAKAKKLIEEFGSIRKIINAKDEDLQKILGKKTSKFTELL